MRRSKPESISINQHYLSSHSNKPSLSTHSSASDQNLTDHSVSSVAATPAPIVADHTTTNITDCDPIHFIQKRVLFVSAIQLYRSYAKIPPFILQNAIFAFGIKRSWILPENQTENSEAKKTYIYHFVSNWSPEFIQIIKRKDQNGHILWIEPCTNSDCNSGQYWSNISNQLRKIVDLSVSKIITKTAKLQMNGTNVANTKCDKSRPSASNVFAKPLSISEQILSPIVSCNEFTFTNMSNSEDAEGLYTDSDENWDDDDADAPEDKSRPSQRDLLKQYYLPLKLDRAWWLNTYEPDTKSVFNYNVHVNDIITQIECIETVNDLQFGALKELFYQSNRTLIPMEYFDARLYCEAHMEDRNKYKELLTYCNTHGLYTSRRKHKKDNNNNNNEYGSGLECVGGYDVSDIPITDLLHTRSSTCDASVISVESNSMLPFRGKMGCDSSREIQLFDSDTNRKQTIVVRQKEPEEDEKEPFVSDEEANHLEYYLSNTIVSSSHSRSLSARSEWSTDQHKSGKRRVRKKERKRNNNNNNNQWSYEPPSNSVYRAKGNILISKQMTNDIIPKRIKENMISNLWQFMDKSSVISKDLWHRNLKSKLQIMVFDFHDSQSGDKLYCVCDENTDIDTNYKWKMRNRLYSADEIECELGIPKLKLPSSIRESAQWKADLYTEHKIRNILSDFDKMSHIIHATKWHKVETQTRHHSKKRMTLSVTCEEFVKYLDGINENISSEKVQLIPIIMFKNAAYRMEFVWIIRIDGDIDIGISMIYHAARDEIEICGIHLDKTYIANQSELISHKYVQCLQDFKSHITNLHIGNPDDLLNRIKDLQKRNTDLKNDKNKLTQQIQNIKQKYDQLFALTHHHPF